MFCNNCGNNNPEGSSHCSACGNPLYQAPVQQVDPGWENSYAQYAAPAAPAKKKSLPITITFIVSVILIIASVLAPMVTPFFDIPVVSLLVSVADADPDELVDDLDEARDQMKEEYEMVEDELSSKEKKSYKKLMDSVEKMADNCSLMNINGAMKALDDMDEEYKPDDMDEAMEAFSQVMGIVMGISYGAFILPLLFAILAGVKKSVGLSVAALIFTAISQLILSGFILLILSVVVYIVQIVLCKKYKEA